VGRAFPTLARWKRYLASLGTRAACARVKEAPLPKGFPPLFWGLKERASFSVVSPFGWRVPGYPDASAGAQLVLAAQAYLEKRCSGREYSIAFGLVKSFIPGS
jgi:hypothetical protein